MTTDHLLTWAAGALLAAGLAGPSQAAAPGNFPVVIDLYTGFVEDPGVGIRFSGPAGQQATTEINFYPNSEWWPLGEFQSFGAHLHSGLNAPTAGQYTLTLGSDDASYLFIDGQLALALPDAHSYYTAQNVLTLSAGYHTLSLQFYNSFCCNSKLILDAGGLAYINAVPEPGRLPLWLVGLLLTGLALRRQMGTAG